MRYVLVCCLWFLLGCTDTPIGPTEEVTNDVFITGGSVPGPGIATPGVTPVPVSECETIAITARRVLDVSPTSVTLRVLADYTGEDAPRVRIVDRATGVLIGDFTLGDITLTLSPGSYSWFIFVEVDTADGVIQCDGSVSFVIPEPPCVGDCGKEPKCDPQVEDCDSEPPCQGETCEPPPECEDDSSDEREECEPPPPCQLTTGGPFPQQGPPREECAFFGLTVGPPGLYICKAGTEIFSNTNPFTGDTCPNGKEISHITTCSCPEQD